MVLLRRLLGDVLRRHRQVQSRTLREVSSAARVSLGYLSEVERGHKEASSELLAAICDALGVPLSDVLREVSDDLALQEAAAALSAAVPPVRVPPAGVGPVTVPPVTVPAAVPPLAPVDVEVPVASASVIAAPRVVVAA